VRVRKNKEQINPDNMEPVEIDVPPNFSKKLCTKEDDKGGVGEIDEAKRKPEYI